MASVNKLKVVQFRFYSAYGQNNNVESKNFPQEDAYWINGIKDNMTKEQKNLLSDYGPAKKIGIQGLPGTIFYLNNSTPNGIMIDHTGVYELDLRNTTASIGMLYFDAVSMATIAKTDNAVLIVDVLYQTQTEGGAN